ncbi:uncharacterized protein LOC117167665 isoform X10 [Belonocnema kinseyi]|uniref:uncharacterized protein LOC117167665 isoform X10 n=1 Tax=Belonocnema kinseyi TaxID=2817044 RepID=UPI00143CF2EB|nr:uncharacterized protein LOC117167665 isoform X10 [Belonocnema kinseyi]
MAEVGTKKSMNVVSKKNNEVCSVHSNNSLIDLDNISTSNNQLISLCDDEEDDDELILSNNTKNELTADDKSLQELIENELALRICSGLDDEEEVEEEEEDSINVQPEIKKIVIEPRQDPLDVNAEFIVAEIDHYSLIEEPYGYQNGHIIESSPKNQLNSSVSHEMLEENSEQGTADFPNEEVLLESVSDVSLDRSSKEVTEKEVFPADEVKEVHLNNSDDVLSDVVDHLENSKTTFDQYLNEQNIQKILSLEDLENVQEDSFSDLPEADRKLAEFGDPWSDLTSENLLQSHHISKFSDDFNHVPNQSQSINDSLSSKQEINSSSQSFDAKDSNISSEILDSSSELDSSRSDFDTSRNFDSSRNNLDSSRDLDLKEPISCKEALGVDEKDCSPNRDTCEGFSGRKIEVIRVGKIMDNDECLSDSTKTDLETSINTSGDVENDNPKVCNSKKVVNGMSQFGAISVNCTKLKPAQDDFDSWTTVGDATIEENEVESRIEENNEVKMDGNGLVQNCREKEYTNPEQREDVKEYNVAPLATVDVESSEDSSYEIDSENREEVLTTSTVVTSSSTTTKTKTKKKKIEGTGSDASPNHTPRTKKTKKSKKSDLEKENISVCRSFGDISNMSDGEQVPLGNSEHAKTQEKTSFNKFDALSKKSVLHVRSVDAGKVQQQLNAVGQNGDANSNCRSCGKVVFQMEQTKAEGLVWHKNCFRCVQCSKQLSVDNYESHESTLYCKAHFKELFLPKPVEESDQPVRPRKPEMIIRENQPKELPPDVVRASDKPDLGLEELSTLNVKSRFQVFEKASTETTNDIERSSSQVAVKRSPSILSKLAKFQAKGMDIGVADESLNGIPYEESSESEEEIEEEETEELETEIIRAKRGARERPISFTKMDDMKNRWETTSQQGRRESQREARKEEIAGIRSRLFMGKQGKMKELYQQAVADSERVTKINAAEEIQHATNARSIKEKFEKGEPIATSDDENDGKLKQEKPDEEVIAAGISRKSRSLFLELDATAAKTGRPVTPVNHKSNTETPRRARDAFMGRQVSDDVVRSTDTTEEVQVETSDISNKFKFFETYREPEKRRRQFRITPPRDGQEKMSSPDREIYRDPDVIRADDKAEEVVHSDTARKMLSIFRQMEENATKEDLPDGPKPLKRFTPPPEDKFAKTTASESEDEEDEEAEESEDDNPDERDPNYVRASDKVEDEFLKQAQNAARAKTLRAKFEQWETTDGKTTSHNVAEMEMAQGTGDQSSIESASSLRARFESLGSQSSENPRTPKVKVNRFVEIQSNCTEICESCEKKVYPLEKVETNNKIFHKQCFRCLQCNCILRMDTFTLNNGKLYCIPHFKQLFITRGNYDEGFGVDPHKNKWTTNTSNSPPAPTPIAVSNGDL